MQTYGMNRRTLLVGGLISSTSLLAACGGGSGAGPSEPIAVIPGPTPSPAPTPTPPPAISAGDAIKQRLRAAANSVQPVTLFGDGATIVVSLSSADTSPIQGRRLVPWNDPAIRYVGRVQQTRDAFPYNLTGTNRAVNYGAGGIFSNKYFAEFQTDARVFEIVYVGTGQPSENRVLVNGRYVQFEAVRGGTDGNTYVSRVTLSSSELRNIRVETIAANLYGIYVGASDRVIAPESSTTAPVRGLIIGDSYTEGASGIAGVSEFEVYAAQTARSLGWRDFYQSGVGATGYLATRNGSLKFRDRLSTDVFPFQPEVVVVAGGLNDPFEGLQSEAAATFDAIRAGLPDTPIFVVGPWTPFGDQSSKAAAIRAAVGSRGNFYYVDNADWLTGGGSVGRPTGQGNGDTWVGADGTHLTQIGHDGTSMRLVSAIKTVYASW